MSLSFINHFKGSFFHPQWLSDRYHLTSRNLLTNITGGVAIDIGSGKGSYLNLINSSTKIFCIDYPHTNYRYELLPDIFADAASLPIASCAIDFVLLLEVIEHVLNYQAALKETYRVLKPGGQLYVSAPFIYPAHDVPYDFHRFTIYGLRAALKEAGYKILKERQHGNSIVVALQLMNLTLLEWVKKSLTVSPILGTVSAILAYPCCLLNNLIALPFIHFLSNKAAVFGHFFVCEK